MLAFKSMIFGIAQSDNASGSAPSISETRFGTPRERLETPNITALKRSGDFCKVAKSPQ
jgi:hypothetical protein